MLLIPSAVYTKMEETKLVPAVTELIVRTLKNHTIAKFRS